jgi:hypothetical protein
MKEEGNMSIGSSCRKTSDFLESIEKSRKEWDQKSTKGPQINSKDPGNSNIIS